MRGSTGEGLVTHAGHAAHLPPHPHTSCLAPESRSLPALSAESTDMTYRHTMTSVHAHTSPAHNGAHHVVSDEGLQFEHDLLSGHEARLPPRAEGFLGSRGGCIHLVLTHTHMEHQPCRARPSLQCWVSAGSYLRGTGHAGHHLLCGRVVVVDPLVCLGLHQLASDQQLHCRLSTGETTSHLQVHHVRGFGDLLLSCSRLGIPLPAPAGRKRGSKRMYTRCSVLPSRSAALAQTAWP